MTKKTLAALFYFACWCPFISCHKTLQQKEDKHFISSSQRELFYRIFDAPLSSVLQFPEDIAYEKIDMARYVVGNVMKDFLTVEISDYILQRARASENSTVDLQEVFDRYPDFFRRVEAGLASSQIEEIPYGFRTYNDIISALNKDGEHYDLEFHVPNAATSLSGVLPIFSPGLELDDEELHPDQVGAWILDAGGEKNTATFIKIDENEMLGQTTAFMSISLRNTISAFPGIPNVFKNTANNTWSSQNGIKIKGVKINERFEKHGASEVCYNAAYKLPGGWARKSQVKQRDFFPLVDVAKKNIGTWRGVDNILCYLMPVTYNEGYGNNTSEACMWNTYERDWWESAKTIASDDNSGYKLTGNTTFSNETYMYKPADATPGAKWCISQSSSDIIWNAVGQTNMNGNYQSEMNVEKY